MEKELSLMIFKGMSCRIVPKLSQVLEHLYWSQGTTSSPNYDSDVNHITNVFKVTR